MKQRILSLGAGFGGMWSALIEFKSNHLAIFKALGIFLVLLLAGCVRSPDVRLGHGSGSGETIKRDAELFSCIKAELHDEEKTFLVRDHKGSSLFIGAPDPLKASGLIQLSEVQGGSRYSVYQRHAWYDQGRLIKVAARCSEA